MSIITAFLVACQAACITTDPFLSVAKAIMWQESKGDPNAIGDGGRAIGPYQIHKAYWIDGTRFLGVSWPYSSARDPLKAMAVVRAYTEHYARPFTPENIARVHNGGPHGSRKAATLAYWRKIERIMQQETHR